MSYILRVLLCLVFVAPVFAQETFSWIGQKVVIKYAYPVKVGDRVMDDGSFHVYRVTRANGDWLWVTWQSIEGWLPASQVVLFDQAINFYTQEIAENPGNSGAWGQRGNIWEQKQEYDIAIADLNEAIRLNPVAANAYNNRGNAWGNKKEYDKEIADYNEAIRLNPTNAALYANRGWARANKKEYEMAIADCNEAIRLNPTLADAYDHRGVAWRHKKEYDKAIADHNQVIRLDPKHSDAYTNRALAWNDKREYGKAISDLNEAIRLDPKDEGICDDVAWFLATCPEERYRDGKRAVELATLACELTDWKDADDLGSLAAAYAEVGDFEKAIEFQEKASKLYTDSEDRKKGEDRLSLYKERKPYRKTE